MKKFVALLLAVLLLALPGCKSNQEDAPSGPETTEPLRVFIDVEFGSNVFISLREYLNKYEETVLAGGKKQRNSFENTIKNLGGPEDIEIEIPPKHGQERELYLTALRTEMMAGKGPDVFVTLSGFGSHPFEDSTDFCFEESLFKFPQQAMERNMFLPLDEYIENAQFMEWDKLTPVVMEAGKNEHGQLLLPMTYTINLSVFKSEDIEYRQEDPGLTRKDMLAGPLELVSTAVNISESMQSLALAPLADYKNDKLAVSEEELLEYITSRDDARKSLEGLDIPDSSYTYLNPDMWFDEEYGHSSELALIPSFSRTGGYNAMITSFAAINANTKRPDDAFFVVDYILSQDAQQSPLYAHMLAGNAVPTMEGLMSGRGNGVYDVNSINGSHVTMSKNLYREFEKLRDGISGADFYTVLDKELYDLTSELYQEPDKPVDKAVHDAYMRMNMMLAES